MKHFTILLILTVLLSGCAKTTPTETIIDNHIGMVDNALEYAYNNMEQTKDVIFLENELEMCKTGLMNAKESHFIAINECEARVRYWRLATFGLIGLFGILVFLGIKRRLL